MAIHCRAEKNSLRGTLSVRYLYEYGLPATGLYCSHYPANTADPRRTAIYMSSADAVEDSYRLPVYVLASETKTFFQNTTFRVYNWQSRKISTGII